MNRWTRNAALLAAVVVFSGRASAENLKVDADKGNSTLSAVFDAPLGERIMAVSNAVGCDLTWDDKGMTISGTCSVPLTAIRVDNDDTKSDHFRQWATNKKGKEKTCKLAAKFSNIKPDKALVAEQPVSFSGDVPFTICDRAREDGKPEHVTGTVVLLPGDKKSSASARTWRASTARPTTWAPSGPTAGSRACRAWPRWSPPRAPSTSTSSPPPTSRRSSSSRAGNDAGRNTHHPNEGEHPMKTSHILAGTVAALMVSGVAHADSKAGKKSAAKTVHCGGLNSCSGQGSCASADNACKGKNSCSGKGWSEMSSKDCKDKKGTVVAAAKPAEKTADKPADAPKAADKAAKPADAPAAKPADAK